MIFLSSSCIQPTVHVHQACRVRAAEFFTLCLLLPACVPAQIFPFLPYCVMVCHTPIDWQGQRRRRRWQPHWPGCHRWQRRPQGRALPLQGIWAMKTKGRAAAATRTQLGYRTVSGRSALCCRGSLLLTQVNACQRSRCCGHHALRMLRSILCPSLSLAGLQSTVRSCCRRTEWLWQLWANAAHQVHASQQPGGGSQQPGSSGCRS